MECATVWFLNMNMPSDWKEMFEWRPTRRSLLKMAEKRDDVQSCCFFFFSSGVQDSSWCHNDDMKLLFFSYSISAIFWFKKKTKYIPTGLLLYRGHISVQRHSWFLSSKVKKWQFSGSCYSDWTMKYLHCTTWNIPVSPDKTKPPYLTITIPWVLGLCYPSLEGSLI